MLKADWKGKKLSKMSLFRVYQCHFNGSSNELIKIFKFGSTLLSVWQMYNRSASSNTALIGLELVSLYPLNHLFSVWYIEVQTILIKHILTTLTRQLVRVILFMIMHISYRARWSNVSGKSETIIFVLIALCKQQR